jgi:hypothetical protein
MTYLEAELALLDDAQAKAKRDTAAITVAHRQFVPSKVCRLFAIKPAQVKELSRVDSHATLPDMRTAGRSAPRGPGQGNGDEAA